MPERAKRFPKSLPQLRRHAEAQLAKGSPRRPDNAPAGSAKELLHELQVHQIELEMQNEALRLALIALEASRDRYVDLYEFAPISYVTLTVTGQVAEMNLTAAALLGDDRGKLLHRRFARFVAPEDQDTWYQHSLRMLKDGEKRTCELRMQRRDGTLFDGYLYCSLVRADDAPPALRIAITDITERKQTEAARRRLETRLHLLTRREREVLELALSGMPNKDISTHLRVSQRTVENHRARIHSKTGVISLLELAQKVAKAGVMLCEIAPPADGPPS